MGILNEKTEYFSKDDSEVKGSNKLTKNKYQITNRRRNNSTHTKGHSYLIKKFKEQIENQTIDNKKLEKKNNNNNQYINQKIKEKNKRHKCLSYEPLEKIEKSYEITNENPNIISDHKCKAKLRCSSSPEINENFLTNEVKQDIYKDMNNENSNAKRSKTISFPNLPSNKELQIIDKNMKSLFLNPSKSTEDNSSTSKIQDYKNLLKIYTQESQESAIDYELNYYRIGNAIRNSYIQKLVSKALYLPDNRAKTHNSLIIFDWDDTLLPTSFLTPDGIFNQNMTLTEIEQKKISKLEKSALNLLNMALSKGDVYIITNAGLGWVEYSAQKFYPNIYDILPKIQIISARGEWEKAYPGDSRKWKIHTFLSLQDRLNKKLLTNIICLGDSLFEIEAGRVLANCFKEAFVKTIKFKEGPKLEELSKQLALVINQFNSICSTVKNLTIRVEKKKKGQ